MELIWWLKAELEKASRILEDIGEDQCRKSWSKDQSVHGRVRQISAKSSSGKTSHFNTSLLQWLCLIRASQDSKALQVFQGHFSTKIHFQSKLLQSPCC